MGTEVALSFNALRTQLENEKSSLYKIDENIKKIVQTSGRFQSDRFNSSGEYFRGGQRFGGRNSFPEAGTKSDDLFGKRKHETKTVFSRLSARTHDSDGEEESPGPGAGAGPGAGVGGKRARVVSAVSRELPTRAAVLRAQGDDEQARTRNRRIFGSLLGTLQKFKQEEIVLQTKEDKKAQVERKIEEQARLQKEKEQRERKSLFAERDLKKATIKALEAKMGRVQEFERWEASQKSLSNFILTKCKPHIYWLPKKMTDKANEKLTSSRKFHEKCMQRKRVELQDELQRIEQRCLRRGPAAKENDPASHDHPAPAPAPSPAEKQVSASHNHSESSQQAKDKEGDDDKGKKRDKFAMDVDDKEKEDSDGEEHHTDARAATAAADTAAAAAAADDDDDTQPEAEVNQEPEETNTIMETETTEESNTALEPSLGGGDQTVEQALEKMHTNGDVYEETTEHQPPESYEETQHS